MISFSLSIKISFAVILNSSANKIYIKRKKLKKTISKIFFYYFWFAYIIPTDAKNKNNYNWHPNSNFY